MNIVTKGQINDCQFLSTCMLTTWRARDSPIYNVRKCEVESPCFYVVMKFDKLLSVIVRRCKKHVHFKLTNKRPTDRCLLTNNRHSVPMMYLSEASSLDHLGLYGHSNKRTIQSCFCTPIIIINQNKYETLFLQLLFYKLQYIMNAVTSPSNNFAIT